MEKCNCVSSQNGKSHPVKREKDLFSSNESISNERKIHMSKKRKGYYNYNLQE